MNLGRLAQRVLHMLQPGRVTLVDDTGPVQRHQVDFGPQGPAGSLRIFGGLPHIGRFGFTSVPPLTAEVLAVFFEGDPTKGVVLGTNHQPSRMKNLQAGDSAMHDVRGVYLWFGAGGPVLDAGGLNVVVQNAKDVTVRASEKVRHETPLQQCTGDVVANCDGTAMSLQALWNAFNSHTHTDPQGGVSGPANPQA